MWPIRLIHTLFFLTIFAPRCQGCPPAFQLIVGIEIFRVNKSKLLKGIDGPSNCVQFKTRCCTCGHSRKATIEFSQLAPVIVREFKYKKAKKLDLIVVGSFEKYMVYGPDFHRQLLIAVRNENGQTAHDSFMGWLNQLIRQ